MKRFTICITGGHLTPALAVIDEISKSYPGWDLVFVGRRYAGDRDTDESEEFRIISGRGIPFHNLKTGRLLRSFSIGSIVSLFRLPAGLYTSYFLLRRVRPDAVLSFGGYLALPVSVSAWMLGIPVVTHEQTHAPGLANRIIARVSAKICVSYPETAGMFPVGKTVVTGLPVRASIFTPPVVSPLPIRIDAPVIYITGGATGARSMNKLLYGAISRLVRSYVVVHQVGRAWLTEARIVRAGLRGDRRYRYNVFPYLNENEHSFVLHNAAVCVGRSGANTVAEVTLAGKPAVYIPLPWSGGNEQWKNTEAPVAAGQAISLDQNKATPKDVIRSIAEILASGTHFTDPDARDGVRNAARAVCDTVKTILPASGS